MWKLQKSLYGLSSAPKRWQEHLKSILTKVGSLRNSLTHASGQTRTKRLALALHIDELLRTGRHPSITEVPAEFEQDHEIVVNEVKTKLTRYLGRALTKTKEGGRFGVDAGVCFEQARAHQHCVGKDEKLTSRSCLHVNRQSTDSSWGKLLWIDRADLPCAMVNASSKLGTCELHRHEEHPVCPTVLARQP